MNVKLILVFLLPLIARTLSRATERDLTETRQLNTLSRNYPKSVGPLYFLDLNKNNSRNNSKANMTMATLDQGHLAKNQTNTDLFYINLEPLIQFMDFKMRTYKFLESIISRDNFYLLRQVMHYSSKVFKFLEQIASSMIYTPQDTISTTQRPETPPNTSVTEPALDYSLDYQELLGELVGEGANKFKSGNVANILPNLTQKLDKVDALNVRFIYHLGNLPNVVGSYFGLAPGPDDKF